MYKEIWSWDKCKTKIKTLRDRLGFTHASKLKFLRLSLSLEDGQIHDELRKIPDPSIAPSIYCILSGYAEAHPVPEASHLISFEQLRGGRAYHNAFARRAIQPLEKTFGSDPSTLYDASKPFGALKLDHGDCSVKIYPLPLVPIIVVLWGASSEFPASANILFDSSISNYLSTEQIAMLSELTTARLRLAHEIVKA